MLNEQNSSGQVSERVLHLSAFDSVLAVFVFKALVGIGVFQTSGSMGHAVWSSFVVLSASSILGALFGIAVPGLLRRLGNLAADATVAFAIAVILLVAVMHAFKFSPVLAALTFGMWLALPLIAARFVAKTAGVAIFAHASGVSWRKGVLTGHRIVGVIAVFPGARHIV